MVISYKLMELASEISQDTQVGPVPREEREFRNKGKFDLLLKPRSLETITSFQLQEPLWSLSNWLCLLLCALPSFVTSSSLHPHLCVLYILIFHYLPYWGLSLPPSTSSTCELVCLCPPQRQDLSLHMLCYL